MTTQNSCVAVHCPPQEQRSAIASSLALLQLLASARNCCLHLHFSSPAAGCWHQPCWAPAAPTSLQLLASFLPPKNTCGTSGPSDAREGCDCSNEPSKQAPRGATRDTTLVVLPSPGSGTGTETRWPREGGRQHWGGSGWKPDSSRG